MAEIIGSLDFELIAHNQLTREVSGQSINDGYIGLMGRERITIIYRYGWQRNG